MAAVCAGALLAGRKCVPKAVQPPVEAVPSGGEPVFPKAVKPLVEAVPSGGEAGEGVAATLTLKDLIFRAQQVTEVSCLTYPVVRRRLVPSWWTLVLKDLVFRSQRVTVVSCYPRVRR
jgi:hypothetical protein